MAGEGGRRWKRTNPIHRRVCTLVVQNWLIRMQTQQPVCAPQSSAVLCAVCCTDTLPYILHRSQWLLHLSRGSMGRTYYMTAQRRGAGAREARLADHRTDTLLPADLLLVLISSTRKKDNEQYDD